MRRTAALALTIWLVLASLAGGLPFWLRRVGLLAPRTYQSDLRLFCRPPLQPWWLPASCGFRRRLPDHSGGTATVNASRFHRQTAAEWPLRAARPAALFSAVLLSLGLIGRRQASLLRPSQLLPSLPLLLSTVAALVNGWLHAGAAPALLAAADQAHWLLLLPLVGWLGAPVPFAILQGGMAALLLVQLPFGLVEAMRGVPLSFGPPGTGLGPFDPPLPGRLAMTFLLPNTLGVVAALLLAFCWIGMQRRRWLAAPALLIVALARSGTGLALVLVLMLFTLSQRWMGRLRVSLLLVPLLLVVPPLLLWVLPGLTGRPDLLNSLSGRLSYLGHLLHGPPLALLFGHGLPPAIHQSTDSDLVRLLLTQGLLGVAAFYGLLLVCWRCPESRLFVGLVAAGSLTLEVSTFFPLSLLLAVVANRALHHQPASP